MMFHTFGLLFTATAALVGAQVSFNTSSGVFSCPLNATAFCAGDSLATNIILRCTNGSAFPGNCNDNLAGLDPVGVKSSALCYQSTPVAGNAACSYNGTAYPDSGAPFPIPGNSSSSTTNNNSTSSSSCSSSSSSAMTTNTGSPQHPYVYHAAGGDNGDATGSVSILPITTTQTSSHISSTASASSVPVGTPSHGLPVPYSVNCTVPNVYGTPSTGGGAVASAKPSPFVGTATKLGNGGELNVVLCAGVLGGVVMMMLVN